MSLDEILSKNYDKTEYAYNTLCATHMLTLTAFVHLSSDEIKRESAIKFTRKKIKNHVSYYIYLEKAYYMYDSSARLWKFYLSDSVSSIVVKDTELYEILCRIVQKFYPLAFFRFLI